MRYKILTAILLAIIAALSAFVYISQTKQKWRSASILNLIVEPESYIGNRVFLHGYLRDDPYNSRFFVLYLTKEDALMRNEGSSILVEDLLFDRMLIKNESCQNSYVEVTGIFGMIESIKLYGINEVESVYRYDLDKDPVGYELCWQRK